MSDLIKRSDVLGYIRRLNGCGLGKVKSLEYIRKYVERLPSADRPQGEWIEQEDCWQCSECGDEYVLEIDVKPIDARMNFCPNCGARMKGADDE